MTARTSVLSKVITTAVSAIIVLVALTGSKKAEASPQGAQNGSRPESAPNAEGFLLPGEAIFAKAVGDLNKDGVDDMAVIIKSTNSSRLGIIIAFKSGDSYNLMSDMPEACTSGGHDDLRVEIARGSLRISHTEQGENPSAVYAFRYEANDHEGYYFFRLIGYDSHFRYGNKGRPRYILHKTSINFLTNKKHVLKEEGAKEKIDRWEDIAMDKRKFEIEPPHIYLSHIPSFDGFKVTDYYSSQSNPSVFTVNTPEEFVNAIGSNREIKLAGAKIDLSTYPHIDLDRGGKNYSFSSVHDGHELIISGVRNLKITGLGHKPVKLIVQPRYANVLFFKDSENITIENIDAGHTPEEGYCEGGVLKLVNSKNITVNNSILFGSGMEGITAEDVTGFKADNTIIRGCTYSIMTLRDSKKFEFNNCEFTDNREFNLVNITNSSNIVFNTCKFTGNKAVGDASWAEYALFDITQSSQVILSNSLIENNKTMYFANDRGGIVLRNTKFAGNSFVKGEYKN